MDTVISGEGKIGGSNVDKKDGGPTRVGTETKDNCKDIKKTKSIHLVAKCEW